MRTLLQVMSLSSDQQGSPGGATGRMSSFYLLDRCDPTSWPYISKECTGSLVMDVHKSNNRLFRLNGFLLKEGAGYSREFEFNESGTVVVEDVSISSLEGILRLSRTPQGVLVQGTLHARIAVECVRCLAPTELPFEVLLSELFLKPEPHPAPGVGNPASPYRIEEGGFIDLTPIVREEAILAIPIQVLCSPDCKGLCVECGQNLNEGACDCKYEPIDPRMAPLRALLED